MASLKDFDFTGDGSAIGPDTDPRPDGQRLKNIGGTWYILDAEGEIIDEANFAEPGVGDSFDGQDPTVFAAEGNPDVNYIDGQVPPIEAENQSAPSINDPLTIGQMEEPGALENLGDVNFDDNEVDYLAQPGWLDRATEVAILIYADIDDPNQHWAINSAMKALDEAKKAMSQRNEHMADKILDNYLKTGKAYPPVKVDKTKDQLHIEKLAKRAYKEFTGKRLILPDEFVEDPGDPEGTVRTADGILVDNVLADALKLSGTSYADMIADPMGSMTSWTPERFEWMFGNDDGDPQGLLDSTPVFAFNIPDLHATDGQDIYGFGSDVLDMLNNMSLLDELQYISDILGEDVHESPFSLEADMNAIWDLYGM